MKIYKKNMSEQKKILINTHENWKNKEEQLDDICVIGVKTSN